MMNRRRFLHLAAGAGATLPLAARALQSQKQPNIVFIYADDLGYGDLGCYGNEEVKTPHIDRLASEGTRLTNFYAAPVCCPSRAGFLTGRHPQRNGMLSNIRNDMVNYRHRYTPLEYATSAEMTQGLDEREVLASERLKDAGYATGVVGKWDSGRNLPYLPLQRGFDFFYGFANTGIDYWTHERYGVPSMFRGNDPVHEEGYATDLFAREARRFIESHKDRPFFLYVPFNAPHSAANLDDPRPQAPDEYIRMYGELPGTPRTRYLANITCLDSAVGGILEKLKEQGLERNTLVIFSSDNGAGRVGSNAPLRGYKGDMYEGGIRVPLVARWPARIPKGATSHEFTSTLDLLPSFLGLAGVRPPANPVLDGHDIVPVLTGGAVSVRKEQFWELRGSRAARVGPWKWVLNTPRFTVPPEDAPGELYDLRDDLGERHDLARERPDVLKHVRERWNVWMDEMARSEPRGPFASREYFRILGFPR